jgi:hypothetical protein
MERVYRAGNRRKTVSKQKDDDDDNTSNKNKNNSNNNNNNRRILVVGTVCQFLYTRGSHTSWYRDPLKWRTHLRDLSFLSVSDTCSSAQRCRALSGCTVTAGTWIALQPLYTYSKLKRFLYNYEEICEIFSQLCHFPKAHVLNSIDLLTCQNSAWIHLYFKYFLRTQRPPYSKSRIPAGPRYTIWKTRVVLRYPSKLWNPPHQRPSILILNIWH